MEDTLNWGDGERFMGSPEGQAFLSGIRAHLEGRTVQKVAFEGIETGISTTLHLDNGEHYRFLDEELALETLYEQFGGVFREMKTQENAGKEG